MLAKRAGRVAGMCIGEGGWGFPCCLSHTPWKPCPAPGPGASTWLGQFLSLSSAGSMGKEGVQKSSSQRGKSWQPQASFLEIPSAPASITDRACGLLWSPGEQPDSGATTLSSSRIKRARHLAPVDNLHAICIHLHTPTPEAFSQRMRTEIK